MNDDATTYSETDPNFYSFRAEHWLRPDDAEDAQRWRWLKGLLGLGDAATSEDVLVFLRRALAGPDKKQMLAPDDAQDVQSWRNLKRALGFAPEAPGYAVLARVKLWRLWAEAARKGAPVPVADDEAPDMINQEG